MVMEQELNAATEQKVIEKLKCLPPRKIDEVIQFIDFVARKEQDITPSEKTDDFKTVIPSLRGRGRGERLVSRLLRSRREDQIADERK